MSKKILFIRPKPVPLANLKVGEFLADLFTDYDVQTLDILSTIRKRIDILILNAFATIYHYGYDILFGHKSFTDAFWRTPFIFNFVKQLVRKSVDLKDCIFSFQMQSLFDCSLPDIPHFVYTDHTHLANLTYPSFDTRKLYPKKWIELEMQIYINAQKIFVRSSNIKKSLVEQYKLPANKINCVYAGHNTDLDLKLTEKKSYSNQNILFVGLDWKRKGGPDLVNAFKQLQFRHPRSTLTIAGATPKLNEPNIHVIGPVPLADLITIYAAADIFCLPTHLEPFGVVFLEAMQARLPIIGSNIGAIPDFIEDGWNGFLIEPGDITGLTDALSKLVADPELCRLFGERNFALSQTKYSWNAVGKTIHNYILESIKL